MITAELVKKLRDSTGAGMMDCKKVLTETNGDFEKSVELLRIKGLAAATKKTSRVASDGGVGVIVSNNGLQACMLELNCETDFVAKNEQFQEVLNKLMNAYMNANVPSLEELLETKIENQNIKDFLASHIAVIGENLQLRRAHYIKLQNGAIYSYIHNKISATNNNIGKIGVLIAFDTAAPHKDEALTKLGKEISMHIAALMPKALTASELDADFIEKEKAVYKAQAEESGKTGDVVNKMVEGRLKKLYAQVVLLEQAFVMDPKKTVKEVIEETAKAIGCTIVIKDFAVFLLGDGIKASSEEA